MSFMDAREHGSKPGSGGAASAEQEAIARRERLRRLALETIDLSKDPYFFRNHLGQYECRLCLTLHTNEGNYLAHTQGKRHQQNLAKRAALEAKERAAGPAPMRTVPIKKTVKIGRPGYRVTKQYAGETQQRSLLFQIDYPEIEEGERPRHRFMSAFEQRKEAWDKAWQYLLFAAEPYEVIAFKIPNYDVEKADDAIVSHWDAATKTFSLQVTFKSKAAAHTAAAGGVPPRAVNPSLAAPPPAANGAPVTAPPMAIPPPRPPPMGMPPPRPPPMGMPPPPGMMGMPPPPGMMGMPPPPRLPPMGMPPRGPPPGPPPS